jgi:hypothetical protein
VEDLTDEDLDVEPDDDEDDDEDDDDEAEAEKDELAEEGGTREIRGRNVQAA